MKWWIKTSKSQHRWIPCPTYGNDVVRSIMKNLLPNGHNCFKRWFCCVLIFLALQVTQSFWLPSTLATVQSGQLHLVVHWSAEIKPSQTRNPTSIRGSTWAYSPCLFVYLHIFRTMWPWRIISLLPVSIVLWESGWKVLGSLLGM